MKLLNIIKITLQEGEDEGITIDGVCVIDQESQKEQPENYQNERTIRIKLPHEHMIVTCKDDEGTEGGEIDAVCYVDPEKYANKVQEMIDASNADADDENEAALADLEALVKDVGGGDADVEKFLNEAFKKSMKVSATKIFLAHIKIISKLVMEKFNSTNILIH